MNDVVMITLIGCTTYRITRFIVLDDFPPIKFIRNSIIGKDKQKLMSTKLAWLGELLTCPWCVSVWVSLLLVIMTQWATGAVPYPVLVWPTAATIGAVIYAYQEPQPSVIYNIDNSSNK